MMNLKEARIKSGYPITKVAILAGISIGRLKIIERSDIDEVNIWDVAALAKIYHIRLGAIDGAFDASFTKPPGVPKRKKDYNTFVKEKKPVIRKKRKTYLRVFQSKD